MDSNSNSNTSTISILYILNVFLNYWILISISVALFLLMGFFYLKFSSKTYSVFARIALKTEQMNSNTGSNAYVNVNDLMNQEKNFTNEITFLRSTPLIKEVIKSMNLYVSYYIKQDKIPKEMIFSLNNIYKSSPFIVVLDAKSPQPLHTLFYLRVLNEREFTLYAYEDEAYLINYETDEIDNYPFLFSINRTFRFGETIKSDYCSFKVLLNSNYNAEEYQDKDLFFKFNSPQILAYNFQEALIINSQFYESSLADLTFTGENLELATDFLNQLINAYIEKNLEKKNYNAKNTIDYIDRQLANISGSLGQSEQQLQNFKSSQDVMNIDEKTGNLYTQMQNLEQRQIETQSRYQYLINLNDYLLSNRDISSLIAPTISGRSDATLASLIDELTSLTTERQNLVNTNQLKNPRIKTLDANIGTIRKVIIDNIAFNISTTKNELDDLETKVSALKSEFEKLPNTQRQLQGLERAFNINDAVYSNLLDKRIQAQIIQASNLPDIEIIEPVRYFDIASPKPKMVLVVCLFFGLLLPSIYIVIVNFLTQKIRSTDELKMYSKLPAVGIVLHNTEGKSDIVHSFPQSPSAEKFHSIRTSIVYHLLGERNKCILITSSQPNEGKSFIALNLAMSFAISHKKIVLIGFDLRKRALNIGEIDYSKTEGVSSYLIGRASLDDVVCKTEIENLDYIPNGTTPPDPVALLSTNYLRKLFDELKQKYDYIIIDSPPYGLVTDAFLLMQYSDIILFVARLGVVTKRALRHCMEDLSAKRIGNVFLVRNDVTKIDKAYGQEYKYNDNPYRSFWDYVFFWRK